MRITPLGDSALLVEIEASSAGEAAGLSQQLARVLSAAPLAGVQDIVPAFCTTAIHYAPGAVPGESAFAAVEEWVRAKVASLPPESAREAREVAIPVCYGGEMGPDLPEVAARSGLSPEAVIAQHSDARYAVRAVGFTPGFPYLAGLPEPLHTPRRATPRSQVPAGSVGIGGVQTGIYPLETPGGWNLIGRTPLALFDVTATPPARLQAGDAVRFEPITPEEFARIEAEQRRPSVHPAQPSAVPDETAPGIEVLRPGLWTSVQDGGRHGWQAQGVPVGGAMDAWALRVGNLLVGNAPEAAALECTLRGPVLRFTHDAVIAVTGATVDGVPAWQPFVVTAGETLSLEVIAGGCRVYLAIAGGVTTPPILGSRSTYVPAAFGGLQGRTLRTGDHLPLGEPRVRTLTGGWRLSPSVVPTWSSEVIVRVVPGTQADWFAEATRAALTASDYRVAPQSDRMGLRLQGPALALPAPREMRSEAVSAGAIQVPPDGQPIVLGADCQTIGGYPKIAHVASVDLPKLGQARPGDTVRFREITLDEARRLRRERERDLGVLRAGLYQRHGLS